MSYSGSDDDDDIEQIDISQWAPRQNTRPPVSGIVPARASSRTQKTTSPEIEVVSVSEAQSESEMEYRSEVASNDSIVELAGTVPRETLRYVARPIECDVQVIIDRPADFDSDDYEDWTGNGDVVNRVLRKSREGKAVYTVEFMDLHQAQVRFFFYLSAASTLSFYCVDSVNGLVPYICSHIFFHCLLSCLEQLPLEEGFTIQ